jgi:FkbM family methyltransferase
MISRIKGISKRIFTRILDLRYSKLSYAQEGEDLLLERIFEVDQSGFFIDVGAHHPKRFSNTYLFYKKGWRGINIDPMPGCMVLFNRYRPDDINLETGISQHPQTLTYYMYNDPALNSFDKNNYKDSDHNGITFKIIDQKIIKTNTLKEILDKYLPDSQAISFLTIDVEGLDLDVLQSNNWNKYRPKIVLIEMLEAKTKNIFTSPIHQFIISVGYSFYCKTPNTVFYKRLD